MSDIEDSVVLSPFFQSSSLNDFEEKHDPSLTVCEIKNESCSSLNEKSSKTNNSGKISDVTNAAVSSPFFHCNLSSNTPIKKERKPKPVMNEEKSKSSTSKKCRKVIKSKKIQDIKDAMTPSPFFNNTDMPAAKKNEKKPDVKLATSRDKNESAIESGVEIKPASKCSRKPRKRNSTVKKDPSHERVIKSPYFAVEADSPEKVSVKRESKQRKGEKWIPPRSPYALIQEDLFDKPWQLLVATIFLTKTRGQLAIPYVHKFLAKWPTPESLLQANFEEVFEIFQPLGLGMVRSCQVFRFTKEFVEKDWEYPIELHGIGKYGNDSYRMFCVNEWREVAPTDIPLSMYKEWITANEEKLGLKQ